MENDRIFKQTRSGKLARVTCQKRVFNYANAGAGGEAGQATSSPLDVGVGSPWTSWVSEAGGLSKTEAQGGPDALPPRDPRARPPGSLRGPCIPLWSNSPSPPPPPALLCSSASDGCPAPVSQPGLVPGLCCLASNPSPSTSQLCGPGLIA